MTIAHLSYVMCDGCGTPAGGDDFMADDAREARRLAKLAGFVTRAEDGWLRDLCPKCRPEETPDPEPEPPVIIHGGYHVKTLPDGRCVDVLKMLYNWRVVLSEPTHQFVAHGWCYFGHGQDSEGRTRTMDSAMVAALFAAKIWDGRGEPPGYDKKAC
jgi:hypothetical protein